MTVHPSAAPARRPLLLHYHLFKNAGSSVDAMLRHNFPRTWAESEFHHVRRKLNVEAVTAFVTDHPELDALSSHTALLPVPTTPDREIFPIVFVRHPLLRLRSVHAFLANEPGDAFEVEIARRTDLAGFLTEMLAYPRRRQVRSFQCSRLARGTPGDADELERALATVEALPFVGLVEAYDRSIARLEPLVRRLFPAFEGAVFHSNARETTGPVDVEAELARMRTRIGDALFDRLARENADDLALHRHVLSRYAG